VSEPSRFEFIHIQKKDRLIKLGSHRDCFSIDRRIRLDLGLLVSDLALAGKSGVKNK
jgi:hypothetical protein